MAQSLNQSRHGLFWQFFIPVSAIFLIGTVIMAACLTLMVDTAPVKQLIAGLAVLSVTTLGSLYLFFDHAIAKRLEKLAESVEGLDTNAPVESENSDEISRVETAIDAFAGNVAELSQQAAAATTALGTAVEETATAASQTTLDIENQKSEAEQVAMTVASMSASARQLAETGLTAREAANTVNTDAVKGREVVGEAVSSIQALAGDVENAAQVLRNLERHSESIGAVLDVIRGIAEQTNLLALNAAIEAARAGEQGRGFAVVADEVRTLASRTQSSTQEIQEMIERLQNGTQSAVSAMTQGHTQAEATVDHAKRAGEALDAIANGVVTITDLNESMASAAQSQNGLADQVQQRVEKIQTLAEHSATQSRRGTAATDELSRRSNDLISKIGMFNF